MTDFNERLKNYREELKIKKKRAMAKKLGIGEQLYYMLESGTREPSKDVLEKLFLLSKRPEEYWLYGVTEKDYIDRRDDFKSSKDAATQLMDLELLGDPSKYESFDDFDDAVKKVLFAAYKADLTHLWDKNKK